MARPYWSGQIRISLVSFGVQLFTATEAKSEIRFHQLSRKTGERVKHQKMTGDGSGGDASPIESSEIVKGYEYRKGEYIQIEPSEIEQLRIPSKKTLDVTQFVDVEEIDPEFFEKPYFVVPENDAQGEAFAVVRKALAETKKVALGKIAFAGREHLVAVGASGTDELPGMMAYTMRYAEELRKPAHFFDSIKKVAIDEEQLQMAKELITRKAGRFEPDKFKDEYEAALRAMVEAKVQGVALPEEEAPRKSAKVINLMDALRKSVAGEGAEKVPAASGTKAAEAAQAESAPGIALVKPVKSAKAAKARKSA